MAALGFLLVGSVSLNAARQAARAAKGKPAGNAQKVTDALEERYLGHFGAGARHSPAKAAVRGVKKVATKTAGASKKARPTSAKKAASRKAASGAKKS